MEAAKNAVKSATGKDSQFEAGLRSFTCRYLEGMLITVAGHQVPIQSMGKPGLQTEMKGPDPSSKHLPTEDGGYQTYKAAKKLEGKKVIITGGDSGIGRAIAILFAMEGAESFIAYLEQEQKDAEETKKIVEEHGGKLHLFPTDLREKGNCQKTVDEAVKAMGGLNILVKNAAYQNMTNGIDELTESVHFYACWLQFILTFD